MAKPGKEKGFILITILFLLLLVAVTAISLNVKSGMQAKMTANQSADAQTYFSQLAVMEKAVWELTKNPWGRTAGSPQNYNGETFTVQVSNSSITNYDDAAIVSVTAPNASALKTPIRYYLSDLFYLNRPERVCHDSSNNLYIADASSHSIFKVDRFTHALIRVAGNGTSGFTGDGGLAINAQLNNPSGVWVDSWGEIYIADSDNHRIRKVGSGGTITTVAGSGTAGYSGDNGPAASATLRQPRGVFVDAYGNIYIADAGNHAIRKVKATTGNIERVAGGAPVAGLGTAGYSGNGGPAVGALLNNPYGVYVSAGGHVYIADTDNCWIRKVDASTQNISTIAGMTPAAGSCGYNADNILPTNAKLNYPRDVYVNELNGEITIADTGNHRIRRFLEGGNITTIAGTGAAGYSGDGGLATSAAMDTPRGVTMKSTGEIVIADALNSSLRQVASGIISTMTGTGNPAFDQPRHIALDAGGNVYIADMSNHRVRKMDPAGRVTTVAGTGVAGYSGDGGLATSAQLYSPAGVAVDGSGNIFIADTYNCCIRKVDAATRIISRVAGKYPRDCDYSGNGVPAASAKLNYPYGVKVNAGNIYIADYSNHLIRKVDTTGTITTVAGTGTGSYSGDNGPATSASLYYPVDVFVDAAGNIFIADLNNNRVRRVNAATQIISTFAGTGTAGYSGDGGPATSAKLDAPRGLFVDAAGNLYIADRDRHVVRVVSAQNGNIYTLAGTGTAGYNWAGIPLPAVTAQLKSPASVAMAETRGGRIIYISDRDNNRIRMLTLKIEKNLY